MKTKPEPSINQHPLYEQVKEICPKCECRFNHQCNDRAEEFAVLLKCSDCGHIFSLSEAARVAINKLRLQGA